MISMDEIIILLVASAAVALLVQRADEIVGWLG